MCIRFPDPWKLAENLIPFLGSTSYHVLWFPAIPRNEGALRGRRSTKEGSEQILQHENLSHREFIVVTFCTVTRTPIFVPDSP